MNRILLAIAGLILCASTANAQQFVAVKVEAEDYISKHADWRLTTNTSTPNVNPDPDGSHAGSASGRAYMELLPDTRVTHSDPLITGRNFWNTAGTGPSLSYNVNIPESGRYIVFVKAYSTGSEDNGIHVGLNNSNPASGARMQWCNGKNQWTWSSAQRTSSNHCGTQRSIFLDFSFAGANTVTFSAREDGFEFDQFILLKTDNNSCAPNGNDQIACNSGTTQISSQSSPEPVAEPQAPSVQPISTSASTPNCTSASSDPDGDGYGWENNASCIASVQSDTGTATAPQPASSTLPVCQSANSDPDGDGYGWEQNASCRINGSTTPAAATAASTGRVFCESTASDPDGDGWGWENSQSCLVR